MSLVPQGKSIQTMYREFRQGKLIVNRRYQRKLVWSLEEKRRLIDSILCGYPVPLILLAENRDGEGGDRYEIIDGIQRLHAIFSFVETYYSYGGRYFDVSQFATASQYAKAGCFEVADGPVLTPEQCAEILDYQLAVTVYPADDGGKVTEVFGRINAGGRQLSPQEQRQAGVTSQFANFVRSIASELRGDVSRDVLLLSEMPAISIESGRESKGYGIRAEETFWCRQGILSTKQLRESEDEQMLADVSASIVLASPVPASKEFFDEAYETATPASVELERKLIAYGVERLAQELKANFSVIRHMIEECSAEANYLRSTVRPGTGGQYPIKAPFYAIFMAFYDLVVRQAKSPTDPKAIMTALHRLAGQLRTGAHYETTDNRVHNINLTKGLIQDYFAPRKPPVLGHGPALLIDFENALRRSRIESSRYEFKQGILSLDDDRRVNNNLLRRLPEIACAMANLGPDSDGHVFLGVADCATDAARIGGLDGISPRQIGDHFVVGLDREAALRGVTLEEHIQKIIGVFQSAELSEPLKTQLLSSVDTITVDGLTVLMITVPRQSGVSFLGEQAFHREGPNTLRTNQRQLLALAGRFAG